MADFMEALARTRVADVLEHASTCPGCCAAASHVSIVEVDERHRLRVLHDLGCQEFEGYLAEDHSDDDESDDDDDDDSLASTHMSGPRRLRLIWLAGLTESETHMHLQPALMGLLHQSAGLTSRFLVDVLETPAWAGLPTDTLSTGPQLPSQAIHYSFLPDGIAGSSCFTQMVAERNRVTYFCINHPKSIRERVCKSLKDNPFLAAQPFLVDVLIAIELLAMRRGAIMRLRSDRLWDPAQSLDDERDGSTLKVRTLALQNLALTWQAILTDLAGIERHIHTLRAVAGPTSRVLSTQPPNVVSNANGPLASVAADKALELVEASCAFLARWVAAYHEQTCAWMNTVKAEMAIEESQLRQQRKAQAAAAALQAHRDGVRLVTRATMMIAMILVLVIIVTGLLGFMFVTSGYAQFTVPHLWWAVPFTAITSVVFAPLCVWMLWSPGAKWPLLQGRRLQARSPAGEHGEH